MLHPDPLAIARFTHPARSLVYSFLLPRQPSSLPPSPFRLCLSHISTSLSSSLRAAYSLRRCSTALSNSRCNIQRLLAVVCGGGSAIATKKRAPRGRSLRPSNWRRCPSTVARVIVSLSLFSRPPSILSRCFCPHPPRVFSASSCSFLLPTLVFLLFLFLSPHPLMPPPSLHRRPLDIEALMQPSGRRWFMVNRGCE